jgi:hypothetical protein
MRKLVTFDFDGTLTLPIKDNEGYWVSGGSVPNEKTIATMKEIDARGHEVAIVTSRICTEGSKEKIAMFVMEHELPVERSVVFTNKEWKADFLEKMGSVLHFEDSKEELERIEAKGIQAVEIPHPPGPRSHACRSVSHTVSLANSC